MANLDIEPTISQTPRKYQDERWNDSDMEDHERRTFDNQKEDNSGDILDIRVVSLTLV